MKFNEIFKEEIIYRDISLKEFAKKTNIPYRTIISYVSAEKVVPSVDYLYRIAKELNVTMEYLITGNEKDNYKKDLSNISRELFQLPPPLFKAVVNLIHLFTEMNRKKEI